MDTWGPAGHPERLGQPFPLRVSAVLRHPRLEFALSSLEAHHADSQLRVPLDAGTALEHLAKASLALRSPALLAELKGETSFRSVTATGHRGQ